MTYIKLKKKTYTVNMSGKKISNFRGLGKNIGAQTKRPMPPSLQKSNWQPHKGWGRSRRI